jgi:hypothetical protein
MRFSLRYIFAIAVGSLMFGSLAEAQATRTWVSGVGDDANPCSRTAPCKTFAGAISKTAVNGEISVLDPGGYGAVTITKSITLNGDGTLGSILAAGTNGININDSATATPGTIVVTLRNLSINGAATGITGINLVSGAALLVDNVAISGFQTGIATQTGDTVVVNSTITWNSNFGVRALTGVSSITLEDSTLTENGVAVQADTGATIRLSNNGIYNNKTGFGCGGGTLASTGNNRKANNVGGGAACAPNAVVTVQ